MVPQSETLTDRTTTHRNASPVSDPSELGSEPDSWLLFSCLRARVKTHNMGMRVSRDSGQPRHGQAATSRQRKNTNTTNRECAWLHGAADRKTDGQDYDAQVHVPSHIPEPAGQRARELVGVQIPALAHEDSQCGHAREPRLGAVPARST